LALQTQGLARHRAGMSPACLHQTYRPVELKEIDDGETVAGVL
jgi:hypothetical protein